MLSRLVMADEAAAALWDGTADELRSALEGCLWQGACGLVLDFHGHYLTLSVRSHPLKPADYNRIIIGIDPGTNLMGCGVVGIAPKRKPEVIALGVIHLSKLEDHYLRLRRIFDRVTALIDQYTPTRWLAGSSFLRQECAVDAQARACAGCGYGRCPGARSPNRRI